mgnify:CR=1 FL=1
MKRLLSLPFTLIILALTATGCGPGLAEVSGKILINGKATGDVSVFFKPRTGGEKIQAIMQSDKTYYFQMPSGQKGLPTGEYVVWLGVIPGQDGLPETDVQGSSWWNNLRYQNRWQHKEVMLQVIHR